MLLDLKHGVSLTKEVISANDSRQDMIAGWSVISFLIAGIFYFVWLYRAISNARSFHPKDITFTPGWSIAWYFIPIVCLYGPYQDMSKLWKASQDPHHWENITSLSLVKWWWFFWLASNIVLFVAKRLRDDAKDIDSLISFSLTGITGYIGQAICAFLLILIMKEICKKQLQTCKHFRAAAALAKTNGANDLAPLKTNESEKIEAKPTDNLPF